MGAGMSWELIIGIMILVLPMHLIYLHRKKKREEKQAEASLTQVPYPHKCVMGLTDRCVICRMIVQG